MHTKYKTVRFRVFETRFGCSGYYFNYKNVLEPYELCENETFARPLSDLECEQYNKSIKANFEQFVKEELSPQQFIQE
jgi:hypothetical protein